MIYAVLYLEYFLYADHLQHFYTVTFVEPRLKSNVPSQL